MAHLPHERYVLTIREESERFLTVLRDVPADAPVPSCAGWTAADLLRHLGTVQSEWAQVVRGADGETLPEPPHVEGVELVTAVAAAGTALLDALASRRPDETCWSWHPDGGSVRWAARRQAHEVLVHRVDAELTAGVPVTPPTTALAVDGVDEVLRVMVDGVPGWGAFVPDGVHARLVAADGDAAWDLALGRFQGTSPTSGRTYDLEAASVVPTAGAPAPDVVITGPAWDLDRWLWGRSGPEAGEGSVPAALTVTGAAAVAARLRALVGEATQ